MKEYVYASVVVDGEVLPIADDYDGIDDTEDGAKIDKIISDISPRVIDEYDDTDHHEAEALAQGVLFLLDKDTSFESIRSSVEQHPSSQNMQPQNVGEAARDIILAFEEELEKLGRYKKAVDISIAKRNVFIATLRSLDSLSRVDLEEIAKTLGHDKNFFQMHQQKTDEEPRQKDWRESQFKDN